MGSLQEAQELALVALHFSSKSQPEAAFQFRSWISRRSPPAPFERYDRLDRRNIIRTTATRGANRINTPTSQYRRDIRSVP
jgi:hypothetical protein